MAPNIISKLYRHLTKSDDQGQAPPPSGTPDRGPLGLGLLPAVKAFVREHYMEHFLNNMYETEIKKNKSWSMVSHACTNPELCSLNVAMPDFSCEYWITCVPAGKAPVFEIAFPPWANYAALTAYGLDGLPCASINFREVDDFPTTSGSQRLANPLHGCQWSGPICILYRIYRPDDVEILPHADKPLVYLIPQENVNEPPTDLGRPLEPSTTQEALDSGNKLSESFMGMIMKALKPLDASKLGTQFFFPISVAGLFPNANANYVIAFLPPDKAGMRLSARVPEPAAWRAYYGLMTVSHKTSETAATLTFTQLGGWASDYQVFFARDETAAADAGYDASRGHKLLLVGGLQEPGIVLRYIHIFECGPETDQAAALEEMESIKKLDGTLSTAQASTLPGHGLLEYF